MADSTHGVKRWNIYYKNCSNVTVKRKVDIRPGRDLPCKTIKPNKTALWKFKTSGSAPVSMKVRTC
ncbi:hypothetical protein [Streptomyces longispororuber]|uniref:hypothetical protein n=1 Tax=Streptomyces longispororuber TaxID=68230 RepID=UPI0037001ADE